MKKNLEDRLHDIEKRLDEVNHRFEATDTRFEHVNRRLDDLEKRESRNAWPVSREESKDSLQDLKRA